MNLLILACSQTKRPDPGLLPAIERYDGPLYRVLRRWQRSTPDWEDRLSIRILSAKYEILGPHDEIADYDQKMTKARASEIRREIECCNPGIYRAWARYDSAYISVGAIYRLALPEPLPFAAEWATGGIGQRSGQLKRWLEGLDASV